MAFVIASAKRRLVLKSAPPPWYALIAAEKNMKDIVSELGNESDDTRDVYLVTISRVLPGMMAVAGFADVAALSSQQVGEAVKLALDDPLVQVGAAGRPRIREDGVVRKLVVFRETHTDGTPHFHVAVKLQQPRRWGSAKATLKARNGLPSHWSSSHTQFWSAIRYGVIPTEKKPVVDAAPYQWTHNGEVMDLFDVSQRPFCATMWKRRREQAEKSAAADPTLKKRRFCKLDLTSIIVDKGLQTKVQVLDYVQQCGTDEMQVFVHQHQKYLPDMIADAKEWAAARAEAAAERETDWALVCRTAGSACAHGAQCRYAQAAATFFHLNRHVLDKQALAASLRAVILHGPSKVTRVPLIVGASNTAKSTLVQPFDQLFGKSKVFHKPAMRSSFPLANIRKNKRFLFWDDFRPVEYAQETLPVDTYLSLFQGASFEVALSGAFNDGNEDVEWCRGAVMTAKVEELWDPRPGVTAEDVVHMKNRHDMFRAVAVLPNMRGIAQCAPHMCDWIQTFAIAFDARQVVRPFLGDGAQPGPIASAAEQPDNLLAGMDRLQTRACLGAQGAISLSDELRAKGAVHVQEVSPDDWQQLYAWQTLGPFEQRRLLSAVRE